MPMLMDTSNRLTMYQCEYFKIHELVPKAVYSELGEKAWRLFDERILKLIDTLRDSHGPAYVNNWFWGGDKQWRGIRYPESPVYSPYSQHTFGRAIDVVFKQVTAEKARQDIRNHIDYYLSASGAESITIEIGVSWLHVDVRNNDPGLNSFGA